jgi:hypothetical protein
VSNRRLAAIMLPAIRAIHTPERIAREKAVDLVVTRDGRVRADRIHGAVPPENISSIDATSVTTSEASAVSLATSLLDRLQDLSDSLVDVAVVAIDTATVNMHAVAGISGTEISADVIESTATAVLDFPNIPAQTCAELNMTVTGAVVGDEVRLGPPSTIEANLSWSGYVSAADTVTIRVCNPSAGAINPVSATWRATVG